MWVYPNKTRRTRAKYRLGCRREAIVVAQKGLSGSSRRGMEDKKAELHAREKQDRDTVDNLT